MSEPFIGEIRAVSWNLVPRGWAPCNGQLLAIAQNQALFSILGTTYGGDGIRTFALPNLQGRVALGTGNNSPVTLGEMAGEENVTLIFPNLPSHTHAMQATSTGASDSSPAGNVLGGNVPIYTDPGAVAPLSSQSIQPSGGGQPHGNMQPYLTINYIIALTGIFPSRS